ncbi:MAG: phosphate ABC transporter substrate-binding protein, partial [Pseudolysinimonas sp.]
GATADTPVSGTGSGGSSAGAAAGSGSAGADSGSADDSSGLVDENGTPLSNGDVVGAAAVSKPYKVEDDDSGSTQGLMIGAGILLFAVILAPPFLSRRLRNPGKP